MKLNTASTAISFAKKLEDDSAKVYQELAQRYLQGKEAFLAFAKENGQNKTAIDRAYYGVISDALEGCFSFEGIDTDDYAVEAPPAKGASLAAAVKALATMEERIMRFYQAGSESSRSLMADVPRAFDRISRKREERIERLKALLVEG
jgi:hypothetical protein